MMHPMKARRMMKREEQACKGNLYIQISITNWKHLMKRSKCSRRTSTIIKETARRTSA